MPYNNRYNNSYSQQPLPIQQSADKGVPIILGYKPSIDPKVLQSSLARADAKWNSAKNLPATLITELNKHKMYAADRERVAESINKGTDDIVELVKNEYNGDWSKAYDDIKNKVNTLQSGITLGSNNYAEYKPYEMMLAKERAQGNKIYDASGIGDIRTKGTLSFDNNRLNTRKDIGTEFSIYNDSKILDNIHRNISTPLSNTVSSILLKKYNKNDILGMLQSGTIKGKSADEVRSYYKRLANSNPQVIIDQMMSTDGWNAKMNNELGAGWETDATRIARAQDLFVNNIASQVTKQVQLNYSRDPSFTKTVPPSSSQHGLYGDSTTVIANTDVAHFTPDAKKDIDISKVSSKTATSPSATPLQKYAFQHKKFVYSAARKKRQDVIDKLGIKDEIKAQLNTYLKLADKGILHSTANISNFSTASTPDPISNNNIDGKLSEADIQMLKNVGIKTVGDFDNLYNLHKKVGTALGYRMIPPTINDLANDEFQNMDLPVSHISITNISGNDAKTNMFRYLPTLSEIINKERPVNMANATETTAWGDDGAIITLNAHKDANSFKDYIIPIRSLTEDAAKTLSAKSKNPMYWIDNKYGAKLTKIKTTSTGNTPDELYNNAMPAEELLGFSNVKGKVIYDASRKEYAILIKDAENKISKIPSLSRLQVIDTLLSLNKVDNASAKINLNIIKEFQSNSSEIKERKKDVY